MYGQGGNSRNFLLLFLGLLCFLGAAILLHSFKGQFGRDTAGEKTVEMMPVMEDTIDVTPQHSDPEPSQALSVIQPQRNEEKKEWVVYVTGSVKKPGVYRIPEGARVYQALDAAGGFSPEADQEAVNLAAMLQDGAHIKFPAKGEAAPVNKDVPPGTAQPVSRTEGMPGPNARVDLTNINTALKEELERLPGVGPKTAEKIIEYREKNGIYQRKEDLLLVKGIGPAKYDAVKNLVTVAQ